jgi:hypothetical protein
MCENRLFVFRFKSLFCNVLSEIKDSFRQYYMNMNSVTDKFVSLWSEDDAYISPTFFEIFLLLFHINSYRVLVCIRLVLN